MLIQWRNNILALLLWTPMTFSAAWLKCHMHINLLNAQILRTRCAVLFFNSQISSDCTIINLTGVTFWRAAADSRSTCQWVHRPLRGWDQRMALRWATPPHLLPALQPGRHDRLLLPAQDEILVREQQQQQQQKPRKLKKYLHQHPWP